MDNTNFTYKQELPLPSSFEFEILQISNSPSEAVEITSKGQFNLLHFHNVLELVYIFEGEGVNIYDNQVYTMQPQDVYIANAFENHASYTSGFLRFACIHFNPCTLIDSVFHDDEYADVIKNRNLKFVNLIRGKNENAENVRALLRETVYEWEKKCEGYRPMLRLLLAKLLLTLNRSFKEETTVNKLEMNRNHLMHSRITEVLDHIHTNYQRQITLEELSSIAHMHKTYFSSYFKKATGHAPAGYITGLRMNAACNLLRTTGMSIKEISGACGFVTVPNFNKAFRKAMSLTPHEYRLNR